MSEHHIAKFYRIPATGLAQSVIAWKTKWFKVAPLLYQVGSRCRTRGESEEYIAGNGIRPGFET